MNHLADNPTSRDAALRESAGRELAIRTALQLGACANAVLGPRTPGTFGILMYHRLAPRTRGVPRPTQNVTPAHFRRQLTGLLARGFRFLPLKDVLAATAAGETLPPRTVVLTFDDGYLGVCEHALPVLRELNVPATVFLATGFVDSDAPFSFDTWALTHHDDVPAESWRPLTTDACERLLASGLVELGAHTHSHADFRGWPAEFEADLAESVAWLQTRLGRGAVPFAFPYGRRELGFAAGDLVAAARRVGVTCGLTTETCVVDPASDPFTWGRFHVFDWDSPATIAARLAGWYSRRRVNRTDRTDRTVQTAPSDPPTVTVIVPTHNRAAWLPEALGSLQRQRTGGRFTFELLVVDNASTDDTPRVLADLAADSPVPLRTFRQPVPGDAPTRNFGLDHVTADWVAFFDDDQIAEPAWLASLLDVAERHGAAVVGGAVYLAVPDDELRRLGAHCRQLLRESRPYDRVRPFAGDCLPGTGNALVARRVFDVVGRFSEQFPTGGSDFDFFRRAAQAGFVPWYAPNAVVRHRVPTERLTVERVRHESFTSGAAHAAFFDASRPSRMAALAAARVVQATFVHLPRLTWSWLRGEPWHVLGHRTRLWRTAGYVSETVRVWKERWSVSFGKGVRANPASTGPVPVERRLAGYDRHGNAFANPASTGPVPVERRLAGYDRQGNVSANPASTGPVPVERRLAGYDGTTLPPLFLPFAAGGGEREKEKEVEGGETFS